MANILTYCLIGIVLVFYFIILPEPVYPQGNVIPKKLQTAYNISGYIRDSMSGNELTGATLILQGKTDRGAITNENGFYSITAPEGSYLLTASFIGYKPKSVTIELNRNINLNLNLEEKVTELEDVTVRSKQPRVILKDDTTEYNAGAYKTHPDATAEDLVTKMPGITVEERTVKAQGETVKKVLVDGQDFFGDDPMLALRNLPAEIVDKIQVFDRESEHSTFTGFSDGNTTKTINVATKMGIKEGLIGKLSGGFGSGEHYSVSGNLNIFNGDRRISITGLSNNINIQNFSGQDILGMLGNGGPTSGHGMGRGSMGVPGSGVFGQNNMSDFFVSRQQGINTNNTIGLDYTDRWKKRTTVNGSYFFNNTENKTNSSINRWYLLPENQDQLYTEENNATGTNFNHRLYLKIRHDIDLANSIIITPRLSVQNNNTSNIFMSVNSLADNLLNTTEASNITNGNGYMFSNSILYTHQFNKTRRTFSLNLSTDINENHFDEKLYALNHFYTVPDTTIVQDQQTNSGADGKTWAADIAYTEPFGKNITLQIYYNPSWQTNYSEKYNYRFESQTSAYTYPDSALSNRYSNSVYTQKGGLYWQFKGNKYTVTASINLQYAELSGDQTFPEPYMANKSFLDLLPAVRLHYRFSGNSTLRLFYRTSTKIPGITQLQNVVDNSNPSLLSTGNPELKQEYNRTFLSHFDNINASGSSMFFSFLILTQTTDYIGNATFIASGDTIVNNIELKKGIQLTMPVNLDNKWNINSFVVYGMPVGFLKSNLNINGGITYIRTPGLINNIINIANTYNCNGRLVLSSNISEKTDFTISYNISYNIVRNTLQPEKNSDYLRQGAFAKVNWINWKSLVLNTDLTYLGYYGLEETYNQDILLWNASLGYKFLKDKSLGIKLSVFDILNRNNNIDRTVTGNYVEDSKTNVLNRYFMFTLTYDIKKFNRV